VAGRHSSRERPLGLKERQLGLTEQMAFHAKTKPSTRPAEVDQPTLFKALSHPLRYRIMIVLGVREASPKELADELDEKFSLVYEHVTRLQETGLIELVDTDTRRGGTQHFYRARTLPILETEDWDKIPEYAQRVIRASILSEMFKDIEDSIKADVFESKPSSVLIRKPANLDDRGMEEVDESSVRHLQAIEDAEANSAARAIAKEGDSNELFRASCLVASFQAAPK
jgi:DNA-binding transcriptional ArsR family regulator